MLGSFSPERRKTMIVLDVPHVFRVFKGPRGLLDALGRHQPDHGLSYPTVQMWQQRETIPTKWVAAVIYCCEQEGHSCREFLVDPTEFGGTQTPAKRRARSRR
jgi:hypothetical protein